MKNNVNNAHCIIPQWLYTVQLSQQADELEAWQPIINKNAMHSAKMERVAYCEEQHNVVERSVWGDGCIRVKGV